MPPTVHPPLSSARSTLPIGTDAGPAFGEFVLFNSRGASIPAIEPSDSSALADLHHHFSKTTIHRRIFGAHTHLTPLAVSSFSVDHLRPMAYVALGVSSLLRGRVDTVDVVHEVGADPLNSAYSRVSTGHRGELNYEPRGVQL